MSGKYIFEERFEKIDFTQEPLEQGEYDACTFIGCNFSEINLTEFRFSECEFIDCNLSMAKLMGAAFRDVRFQGCKMLGLFFSDCNKFGLGFRFENCILNHSSFFQLSIKQSVFRDCQLHEVDFTETDLSGALIVNCDLLMSIFDRSNLTKADLRSSYNFTIDPEINKLKKAKFSASGLQGLLAKYDLVIE